MTHHPRAAQNDHTGWPNKFRLPLTLLPGLVAVGVLASGCGGGDEKEAEDAPKAEATRAQSPSEDPSRFLIANREQFLATGPVCEDLTAWFVANPTDYDVPTIERYVEQCKAIPSHILTDGNVIEEIINEVYAAGVPDTDPGMEKVRGFQAAMGCQTFAEGEKNPISIANDVELNNGGDAEETQAVLKIAVGLCPEYKTDMELFTVPDIRGAGEEFTDFVATTWPDGLGGEAEHLAFAAMSCAGALEDSIGKSIVSATTGEGEEDRLISKAKKLLCP